MDGTTAALQGQVLSLDAQGNKANSTAKTIVGGVVGQIVGNYIGKHIGTNVGGAVGAIGGAIYAANTGQNITIGQGSQVALKTTAPATVLSRRQAGYPNQYQPPQQQPAAGPDRLPHPVSLEGAPASASRAPHALRARGPRSDLATT